MSKSKRPGSRLADFMRNHYSQFSKDCSVQRRGEGWRLRCRMECSDGVKRRISIAIHSKKLAEDIKKVIAIFRDAAKNTKEQNKRLALNIGGLNKQTKKMRRQLERELLDSCLGGRGHKRRVKKAFRMADKLGEKHLRWFFSQKPWKANPNSAGRPEKGIRADKLTGRMQKNSAIMSSRQFSVDPSLFFLDEWPPSMSEEKDTTQIMLERLLTSRSDNITRPRTADTRQFFS